MKIIASYIIVIITATLCGYLSAKVSEGGASSEVASLYPMIDGKHVSQIVNAWRVVDSSCGNSCSIDDYLVVIFDIDDYYSIGFGRKAQFGAEVVSSPFSNITVHCDKLDGFCEIISLN